VALIMELDGLTFQQAIDSLAHGNYSLDRPTLDVPERNGVTWTARARAFLQYTQDKLKPDGVAYLQTRGLDEITAWGAGLGWNPSPLNDKGEKWGLSGYVHLGVGLVIPHEYQGYITAVNIRGSGGYRIVKGSRLNVDGRRLIYKPSPWPVKGKVILFEGELDALAAWQALTDPTIGIGAIPAGNLTQLPDRETWVCFDNDQAGRDASDKAAQLGARVIQVPEDFKDFSDYHVKAGEREARAFLYSEVTNGKR
jgi:DNA primase